MLIEFERNYLVWTQVDFRQGITSKLDGALKHYSFISSIYNIKKQTNMMLKKEENLLLGLF